MKQLMNHLKQKKILLLVLSLAVLFSACKKDVATPSTPVSGLMAFNLIPDKAAVGFVMSNKLITNNPLYYTNYSGNYINVYSGNRNVGLYDEAGDSILTEASMVFDAKKYYSVFAVGANGNYRNVIVNDNFDSIPNSTGEAFVRYINAIPDSSKPDVNITGNGDNIINDANAAFGGVSEFKGITPGDITIQVSNETDISSTRTITLEKGKVYTILLIGIPGATDDANKVQIKFITNASVS